MGIVFKVEKRRVLPKWRKLSIASSNRELVFSSQGKLVNRQDKDLLTNQIKAFSSSKNLFTAGDLLSSAFVLGIEKEFVTVADFILGSAISPESALLKLAAKVVATEDVLVQKKSEESTLSSESKFELELERRYSINRLRNSLKIEPRNSLAWIELGRIYFIENQKDKAERCIKSALHLDSNNRFIVRSASRFFHHLYPDTDKALLLIRRSRFLSQDPMLLSAEIAYSSVLERRSKVLDVAQRLTSDMKYSNGELTELVSSMGTLELTSGSLKKAKMYFEKSLICPNDNSIAQAKWLSSDLPGLNISTRLESLKNAYEASAIDLFEKGNYENAFQKSLKWIEDEPYSSRPVKLASYIAGVYLNQTDKCISILKEGLLYNSDDIGLKNDLIYFLVRKGLIEEAVGVFEEIDFEEVKNGEISLRLTILATTGLILYRLGDVERGREAYLKSIKMAKSISNEYLIALASVNYCKEQVNYVSKLEELDPHLSFVRKYVDNNKDSDIGIFFKEFIKQSSSKSFSLE